jgi:hypothetical protein
MQSGLIPWDSLSPRGGFKILLKGGTVEVRKKIDSLQWQSTSVVLESSRDILRPSDLNIVFDSI